MSLGRFECDAIRKSKLPTHLGPIDKGKLLKIISTPCFLFYSREALWNYFLPTLYEECPVTPEPTVGQTRIFRNFRFKLWLNCPTMIDLYFMNKKVKTIPIRHVSRPTFQAERTSVFCVKTYWNQTRLLVQQMQLLRLYQTP